MTWTAQAHDRQGWWNASAPTYKALRADIIAECKAGRLWGPLFVTMPGDYEFNMTKAYEAYGLRTDERPEPMIDEDEEAAE